MMKKPIIAYRLQFFKKQKSIACCILGSAIGSFLGIAISTSGSLKRNHDTTNSSATRAHQIIAKHRGLEAELTRVVGSLRGVKKARVALSNSEDSSFQTVPLPRKACVMLQLKEGYPLSKAKLDGIVHLVSSAVEHLSPENVMVIDSQGNDLRFPKTQTQD